MQSYPIKFVVKSDNEQFTLIDMTWSQKFLGTESQVPKTLLIEKKIMISTSLCSLPHNFCQLLQSLLVARVAQCLLTLPSPPPSEAASRLPQQPGVCVREQLPWAASWPSVSLELKQFLRLLSTVVVCAILFISLISVKARRPSQVLSVCVFNCAYKKSSPGSVGHYTPHHPGLARPQMRSNL